MEKFKGKWCINVTDENVYYLKEHFKCGAGYHPKQTLFFNENGIRSNCGYKSSWNMDYNNKCGDEKYNEISFDEFIIMVEGNKEPTYEIY